MIISLTGFMGCGKSSVGRRLSHLLCCPFMDLDDVIVESAGRSIPEIFATEGEVAFRRMELEILKEILSTSESRQCAPLAPSHFVGPSPYAGVRRCQFRTSALTPIENLDCHLEAPSCHPEASSCHPEASSCHHGASSCHHEAPSCHHEASSCHPEASSCHHGASSCHHEASSCHPERSEGSINLVLALGGGTVMTPECAEIVKERTCCIYLKASIDTLMEHLSDEADGRPMLSGDTLHERITELMTQRSATYEKTAHVIIDTDGKSTEAIALEIVSMLNI